MEPDDSFGWIKEIYQVSSSEEYRLRSCSYFGQSDSDDSDSDSNSGWGYTPDIPVDSNGITMVSPPESPHDELPNDQYTLPQDQESFHAPPEYRPTSTSFDDCNDDGMISNGLDRDGETAVVHPDSADSRRAVDLGRDTDLGFSEVEVDSTQRIEANSNPDGTSEGIRVSKRGFSPKGQLSTESPSKSLKSLDFESPSEPLGTPKKRNTNELLKSLKKWNLENVSLSPRASSELELENQQNHESNGEIGEGIVRRLDLSTQVISSDSESEERNMESRNNNVEVSIRGKSLDFLTEDIECDTEKRNMEWGNDKGEGKSGRNNNIVEDIHQVRCTGGNGSNSFRMEEKTEKKRVLPSWANNGRVGDDESADEELEVNETELPSWANNRAEDDERADEELEVNEMELPSRANDRVGGDERADEELDVNERETVHMDTGSDSLNENFEEITLLDVLMKMEEDCEEDRSLECLCLLEVAERKWGAFSSDER